MSESGVIELLAALSHESWAGWTRWMMEKWNETHANGETFRQRWTRQMMTPYAELSEQEKESDREEARKVLSILRKSGVSLLIEEVP